MSDLRFVRFDTADGLRLNGIVADAKTDKTVIHVHGRGGNFYENGFLLAMYEEYVRKGINVLAFNNRGHSSYVEAYHNGDVTYVGSATEQFEDCLLDIEAACAYASSFSDRVVLQGHSLGCEKVMYYGLERDNAIPLILLSPSDGYRLQQIYRFPETVEEQIVRLQRSGQTKGELTFLSDTEYGIRNGEFHYPVPITSSALVSLMTGPAFRLFKRDHALGRKVSNKAFVYIGGLDPLQIDGAEAMASLIKERFVDARIELFPEGNHHLRGSMPVVLDMLTSWILDAPGR